MLRSSVIRLCHTNVHWEARSYHKGTLESRYQNSKEQKSSLAVERVCIIREIVEHATNDQGHLQKPERQRTASMARVKSECS